MEKIVFTDTDLPIVNGKVYHLDIAPHELAKDIIIVGDPERVPVIASEFFETVEVDRLHRGLRTMTGIVKESGLRVTVVTSGMGTPSIEIVLNEIMALNEIDFETKERKENYDMINIIRVGSAGGLNPNAKIGVPILTKYSVGMDNIGMFYEVPYQDENCKKLEENFRRVFDSQLRSGSRYKGKFIPYVSKANDELLSACKKASKETGIECIEGITVTSPGFFLNNRISRLESTISDVYKIFVHNENEVDGLRFENIEMETSFLVHYMNAIGYRAGSLCIVVDSSFTKEFKFNFVDLIKNSTRLALKTLHILRKMDQKVQVEKHCSLNNVCDNYDVEVLPPIKEVKANL